MDKMKMPEKCSICLDWTEKSEELKDFSEMHFYLFWVLYAPEKETNQI